MALDRLVIGLTGNIASGKSTVSSLLKGYGAHVLDADKIAHTLYDNNSNLKLKVVKEFGIWILNYRLKINRKKLGKIVFNDSKKMARLKNIVWPYVNKAVKTEVNKLKGIVVLEAALLFESRLKEKIDYSVVVAVDEDIRAHRLIKREKKRGIILTEEDVRKRVAIQMSQDKKIELADHVLWNNSTLNDLENNTKTWWDVIAKVYNRMPKPQ